MATTSVATESARLRTIVEEAHMRIDAAYPQLNIALEALGDNTDAARGLALAVWAIEDALDMLKPVFEGEV